MSDTHILSEKELNYIETLYLSCNLEEFVVKATHSDYRKYWSDYWTSFIDELGVKNVYGAIKEKTSKDCYDFMFKYIADTMLCNAVFIGASKGYEWYEFPNYRLGVMDYDKAKRANNYNVVVQYKQSHMFTLGADLKGLDLPFGGSFEQYKIKRIDITKIAKHKEDYTQGYGYISPYRDKANYYGTIYLGHRRNGNVFRMYNKTKELKSKQDYRKIEEFSSYFGDIEDLHTYELELHRKYLKGSLGVDNLSELSKVMSAYKNIVGRIRIYEDNDYNRKLIRNNNRGRIDAFLISDFKEYERVKRKKYKPSEKYLIDKVVDSIKKYTSSVDSEPTDFDKVMLIEKIAKGVLKFDSLHIDISGSDFAIENKEMYDKFKKLRDNQTNDLEIEAKGAFGVVKGCPKTAKSEELPVVVFGIKKVQPSLFEKRVVRSVKKYPIEFQDPDELF